MRFGYIGLGNIGAPMAEHLVAPGEAPLVFDAVPAAMAPFRGRAQLAASPADIGREADAVAVCVRDDADVRAVIEGEGGLLETMRGGVVAIHSTVRPSTVIDLARAAAAHGVALLDAAVTGGPDGARRKALTCMVGGAAADVARLQPLLDLYCSAVIHAGDAGAGMALKIANNLVTYVELLAALEGYRLAAASGLDPALLDEVMTNNGNLTPSMRAYMQHRRTGADRMGADGYRATQEALLILADKDLALAAEVAAEHGLALPLVESTRRHFPDAVMKG